MINKKQGHKPSLSEKLVRGPSGFRTLLQRLGPTFIKIGQFLALRPDIVPQEYCNELMRLLDRVDPFSWQEAKAILSKELGRDPADIFNYVNPRPIGAGSLAQSHQARLKDGKEVIIKIQRPDIRRKILRDLRRARLFAHLLEVSKTSIVISPKQVVQEVSEWLMEEINFVHELENVSSLRKLAKDSPSEIIPRPYPDFCTSKVLTIEYLHGIPMSELLLALQSDNYEERERVTKLRVDTKKLARNLLNACLTQIFRYQFFHADLHPGNLFVFPDNKIGFVDFGLCCELDTTVRERQMRYLTAIYSGKTESIFKSVMEILIPGEETDVEAFRRDFFTETSVWMKRRSYNEREGIRKDVDQSPTAQWLIQVMRVARKHKLQVPSGILSMYRTLLTAETVANQLNTSLDLGSVGRSFFINLQADEALKILDPKEVRVMTFNLLNILRDSPAQLQQIFSELSDGRFALNVNVSDTNKNMRISNRRTRLLTASILSVGIAILLTRPNLPHFLGISLAWPLSLILIFLYTWIFKLWRTLS